MSKFLKLVAESRPLAAHELNKVTPIKRIFHRALLADSNKAILEDIGLQVIQITDTSDDIILKFNDGTVITYSVEVVKEEDEDSIISAAKTLSEDDPEKRTPVGRSLKNFEQQAKRVIPKIVSHLDTHTKTLASIK